MAGLLKIITEKIKTKKINFFRNIVYKERNLQKYFFWILPALNLRKKYLLEGSTFIFRYMMKSWFFLRDFSQRICRKSNQKFKKLITLNFFLRILLCIYEQIYDSQYSYFSNIFMGKNIFLLKSFSLSLAMKTYSCIFFTNSHEASKKTRFWKKKHFWISLWI